jgi:hypothetical protein
MLVTYPPYGVKFALSQDVSSGCAPRDPQCWMVLFELELSSYAIVSD